MRTGLIIAAVVAVIAIFFGVYMVDVEQTEEASLPDVDVNVESGNMPEYETTLGDVDVGTEEVTVTVPTIDVDPPEDVAENNWD